VNNSILVVVAASGVLYGTQKIGRVAAGRDHREDVARPRQILELAGEFDVPVSDENLTIQGSRIHTVVDGAYTRQVKLLPGTVYYLNIKNTTATGTPDACGSGSCNMVIQWAKPPGT
jgi:hypothetical protein